MVQLGKDDLKGRHYPRGYAMWAVQHNKDSTERIVTLRRSFHQSEPCEDQNKYICQRPAAALEGSESLGKPASFWVKVLLLNTKPNNDIHSVSYVYAVLPFYDVKCLYSGGRE